MGLYCHQCGLTRLTGMWQDGPIGAQNLGWGQPTLQQGLQPSTPGSPPGNGARGGGGGRGRGRGTGKDAGKPPIRGGKGRGKVGNHYNVEELALCELYICQAECHFVAAASQLPLCSAVHGLLLLAPPCPRMWWSCDSEQHSRMRHCAFPLTPQAGSASYKPALMQKCLEVLQEVISMPQASPFSQPVTVVGKTVYIYIQTEFQLLPCPAVVSRDCCLSCSVLAMPVTTMSSPDWQSPGSWGFHCPH
jgi:hypothetical protein